MRIDTDPRLPIVPQGDQYLVGLSRRLYELFRQISVQVNGLSEGSMFANYTASSAAPTTGEWYQGDFVPNSAPTELGTAGSKYVLVGWRCIVSGSPGTWVQQRMLTGN